MNLFLNFFSNRHPDSLAQLISNSILDLMLDFTFQGETKLVDIFFLFLDLGS